MRKGHGRGSVEKTVGLCFGFAWGVNSHPVFFREVFLRNIVILQSQSVNGRLKDLTPIEIQVSYLPENGVVVTDKIRNCHISSNTRKWKEGDTGQEVELPFVPSHIEWGKVA